MLGAHSIRMLTIRFTRKGKKNQPFFRVVVVDKRRSSKGGRSIEDLGYVNPLTKKRSINIERAKHWVSVGARPSSTVHNLFVSEKIIEGRKMDVSKKSKNLPAGEAGEGSKAAEATPSQESAKETKGTGEKTEEKSVSAETSADAKASAEQAGEIKETEKKSEEKLKDESPKTPEVPAAPTESASQSTPEPQSAKEASKA